MLLTCTELTNTKTSPGGLARVIVVSTLDVNITNPDESKYRCNPPRHQPPWCDIRDLTVLDIKLVSGSQTDETLFVNCFS